MSFSRAESGQTPKRLPLSFRIGLCVLSGVMLGFSFPPSTLGVLACLGIVPLLIALQDPVSYRQALGLSYIALVLFHIIVLNWTGGYEHGNDPYMMIAGGVTMLVHPFFYFIPVTLFLFVRRSLGETAALTGFPFLWVAYEYSHSLSEWSFPWMTLGNSHTYDLARIQFLSLTGVFGLSFLLLIMNVLGFVLFRNVADGRWRHFSWRPLGTAALIVVLYLIPKIYGEALLAQAPAMAGGGLRPGEDSVRVGIIQSNLDPWKKWSRDPLGTFNTYLSMTDSLIGKSSNRPDIVLWPETAVPVRLLSAAGRDYLNILRSHAARWNVSVLTGFPHMEVYADSTQAPPSAKRIRGTGERYDDFNAVLFVQPDVGEVPWYGKMKMVPLAERVPYADAFYYLDFLRWGVGIGGWQVGRDSTIFEEKRTGAKFCSMICYESTYPGFVASFVERGAEFIVIVTIDSWWGHMSGAYQHDQFAVLRAVENRRWIARCALGGISCFIDPYGRAYDKTSLFERGSVSRTIGRSDDLTFYTRHGDWLSVGCVLFGGFFVVAGLGRRFFVRQRRTQWTKN